MVIFLLNSTEKPPISKLAVLNEIVPSDSDEFSAL